LESVLATMLERGILWADGDQRWFGPAGEREYGARNFLGLVSSFTSPRLFRVCHSNDELGFVDPVPLAGSAAGPAVLSLGVRRWRVNSARWKRVAAGPGGRLRELAATPCWRPPCAGWTAAPRCAGPRRSQ